jgi:hypothetical protein
MKVFILLNDLAGDFAAGSLLLQICSFCSFDPLSFQYFFGFEKINLLCFAKKTDLFGNYWI